MFYKFLRLGNFNMNNTIKSENFHPICTVVFVLIQSGGFGPLNFWRTATAVIMKFCTLVE